MKKVFFFALASLALASCSQDEEFAPEKSSSKGGSNRANTEALSFSTYTAGGTRATDVTSAEVIASGFKVSAWYDGKKFFDDNALYENGAVADGTVIDEAFDTVEDTYWWPRLSTTDTIRFRAFNNLTVPAKWLNDSCQKVMYKIQETAEAQEDLVIAFAEASEKPEEGVQPLNFTHALSKVNFSFVGDNPKYKYTINKVEVIAAGELASNTANDKMPILSFAETTELGANGTDDGDQPNGVQADKASWEYTAINGKDALVNGEGANQGVLYTYYSDAVGVSNKLADNSDPTNPVAADTKIEMEDQNFMLLPQSDSIAIRVYYKVEDKNGKLIGNCGYELTDEFGRHERMDDFDASTAIYGCKTVVVKLGTNDYIGGTETIPAWEAGKAYRFTMTLPTVNFIGDRDEDGVADGLENGIDLDGDLDGNDSEFDELTPIRFSVTVSNWEETELNSNITIKTY